MNGEPMDVVLIGGASHTGKSMIGRQLADRLGWAHVCTDDMARHPGRPWGDAPDAVAELYRTVSAATLHWLLRIHHQNIWTSIELKLAEARLGARPIVLEGNALRPELLKRHVLPGTEAICLVGSDALLRDRIWTSSGYPETTEDHRRQIDAFVGRTLIDNRAMRDAANKNGILALSVDDTNAVGDWVERVIHLAA